MNATTTKAGFYGLDHETYYVAPTGRVWIVASVDDCGPNPVEIDDLPETATDCNDLMTPDEAMGAIGRVEIMGGETILEWDELVAKVTELAKADAVLFVEEFGEPIDPATTDWDATAWVESSPKAEMRSTDTDRLWPIYQAALVAETERLTS